MLTLFMAMLAVDITAWAETSRKAMDDWKICTAAATREYALGTAEPAETVVTAALGKCTERYNEVRRVLASADGGRLFRTDEIDRLLRDLTDHWRPRLIAGVLDLRKK